jgi:GxxExxY protein
MNHQGHQESTKEAPDAPLSRVSAWRIPRRKALDGFTESVAEQLVDAAIEVHRALGPGLLESVYQTCLIHTLRKRGLRVEGQIELPIHFDGLCLNSGLRLDLLVEDRIVVELKSVEELHPVHFSQLMSYLRLSGKRLGFLINFNVPKLVDGLNRRVL